MRAVRTDRPGAAPSDFAQGVSVGDRINALFKRGFDVTLAITGIIVGAPLLILIACAIWLESPGNVFFSQERLGLHGRRFRMHKFRKFPANWSNQGPGVTVACDARMTRVGAVLERLKFDELPQLWNILKGEMSFVGPRPESCRFADLFTGRYAEVLAFIPGIFGPNQVAFRNESQLYPADEDPESYYRRVLFPQKAEHDLVYFQKANVLTDIGWICRGIWTSVAGIINWRQFIATHSRTILMDALGIALAWTVAHFLRFSGMPEGNDFQTYLAGLWVQPLILIPGMFLGSCYRHPHRCFSLTDAINLVEVVTLLILVSFILLFGAHRNVSLYLVPNYWFVLLPVLVAPRAFIRRRWERREATRLSGNTKIAIYGAGRGGTALANWIGSGNIVGFLDDDPVLRGKRICGCPVLGRESDIPTVHDVHNFQELWITFRPDASKRKRIHETCGRRDIKVVVIPDLEPFSMMGKGNSCAN